MAQSIEEFFITSLQRSGVCAKLDDDVFVFRGGISSFINTKQSSYFKSLTTKPLGKNYNIVSATDGFCEDIHFKRDWFSPYMLAYKAFLVNISDFVAKNATPTFALISLVIARDMKKSQIQEIVSGLGDVCKKFHIKIVGGDTMLGDKLAFHITLFGTANKPIPRYCQKNSLLFCTQGHAGIGFSLKVLRSLLRFKPTQNYFSKNKERVLNDSNINYTDAQNRFYFPSPRVHFMKFFGKYIHASMDISDGLLEDIPKLLSNSNVTIIPSKAFYKLKNGAQKWRIQSGEEYEILFCIRAKYRNTLKRIALKTRTKILFLGKLKRGKCHFHSQKWH